tara:strand:- start:399491 stop:399679 length:189 start_codon:yes stop_codon:yes gene_type:complete
VRPSTIPTPTGVVDDRCGSSAPIIASIENRPDMGKNVGVVIRINTLGVPHQDQIAQNAQTAS